MKANTSARPIGRSRGIRFLFTTLIAASPIYVRRTNRHAMGMNGDLVLALDDSEKLAALREVDLYRPWRSLDDKRRCLVCGRHITGRQIRFAVFADGSGPLRGHCPSSGCSSIPMDWALPRDAYPILRRMEDEAAQLLGDEKGADFRQQTLDEEAPANQKLPELAVQSSFYPH